MEKFFPNFELNRLSFWLGFLTATLFWWLLKILRPRIVILAHSFRERIVSLKEDVNAKIEVQLRNSTLRHAESLHLAAPLFSLSEIIIPPELLAPPHSIQPGDPPPTVDISELVLPYTPDFPTLAATYGWPKLTLAEALSGGSNLVVTGHHGSGKTVALAHLAIEIISGKPLPDNIKKCIPLLIHVFDLLSALNETDDLLHPLYKTLEYSTKGIKQENLVTFVEKGIKNNHLLLLIDGLDELLPEQFPSITDYLHDLLKKFVGLRIVVSASVNYIDGLSTLGLVPITMAPWNDRQRTYFINKWSNLWVKYIDTQNEDVEPIDPVLLNAWLFNDKSSQTPLEQTLKIWASYAGDTLGPNQSDAIEAYLRRMMADVSSSRFSLERIALNSLLFTQPNFTSSDINKWLSSKDRIEAGVLEIEERDSPSSKNAQAVQDGTDKFKTTELVPKLVDNGLLKSHIDSTISFSNPIIHSFLAGCTSNTQSDLNHLFNNTNWLTASNTIGYMAIRHPIPDQITEFINKSKNPLQTELLIAARWLHTSLENTEWYRIVMRRLANILGDSSHPLAIRGRILSTLTASRLSGINVLLKNLITSNDAITRQLAALGLGQIQDIKSISNLISLLNDPVPNVRRAACLALVAVGNSTALEAVAEALLRADDDLQRMAAEALANNFEEGYPTLKEGAALEDLHVRRSVVYGLQRVNEAWSNKILEDLQVHDEQWVVKTAATQALEELALPDTHIPYPHPPLTETPWLISFAGERGIGVAPGKPAMNILLLALREGNEEQKLAALDYLGLKGDSATTPEIYNVYNQKHGDIREAAINTLWQQATMGYEIQATR